MKNMIVTATVVVVVVGIAFAVRVHRRHQDLVETLDWMVRTYNPRSDGFAGQGIATMTCMADCGGHPTLTMTETFSHQGCEFTTFTKSSRENDGGLKETFQLSSIDPKSIALGDTDLSFLGDDGFKVGFKARDDMQALSYSGNIRGKGTQSGFQIGDKAYGERFAKAFKHAVILCGGAPSKF